MSRLFVILRHAFRESISQSVYALMIVLGVVVLAIFAGLPFFTLSEDTIMFKDTSLDFILLFVLISTLFATSKSIYDEIEDRSMMTLMSKPVRRWEVLVGKYLGIVLSALLAVGILGIVLALLTWWRIPGDYTIRTTTLDDTDLRRLHDLRIMHLAGLGPALLTVWMQIAVLAALGVALSTRFSLVVNLPTVIVLYMAGNMARFLPTIGDERGPMARFGIRTLATILPYLENLDVRTPAVYWHLRVGQFANEPHAVDPAALWRYTAMAGGYGLVYVIFALGLGLWMFQTRELGGGEG